jgi:hypothetical protein
MKMHKKLPRHIINKSKMLLIQNIWCEGSTSICGGNRDVIPKFQLKNPIFEKDENGN